LRNFFCVLIKCLTTINKYICYYPVRYVITLLWPRCFISKTLELSENHIDLLNWLFLYSKYSLTCIVFLGQVLGCFTPSLPQLLPILILRLQPHHRHYLRLSAVHLQLLLHRDRLLHRRRHRPLLFLRK